MEHVKVYHTFDEINRELEILKVEKDLAYHKLLKEFDETKESLEIRNLVGDAPKKVMGVLSALSGPLKSAALTFLFKKIF
jgi:hypothetical protein